MRKLLSSIALAALAVASGPVTAQTTGNGPYYANPSWDQQLPAAQRFIVLSNWGGNAVLDRETGLVWERSPSPQDNGDWYGANLLCNGLGNPHSISPPLGRLGWRLPTLQELLSLIDPTQSNPALPQGHPFQGIQNLPYWTVTTREVESTQAYSVDFSGGECSLSSRVSALTIAQAFWIARSMFRASKASPSSSAAVSIFQRMTNFSSRAFT